MELAPRVLSLLPILTAAADLYAAMARMTHVPEEAHLTYVTKRCKLWTNLVLVRTPGGSNFAVRQLAFGLLATAVCDQIRAAIPPPDPRPTSRDRTWIRRAVLFGAQGQRSLSAGMRHLLPEDQANIIRACAAREDLSWAASALVGARSANVVEHALRHALNTAHVASACIEEDALEATDFVLTWPRIPGGYLIQVKTATQRDEAFRVLIFNHSRPHRHQFLMDAGHGSRAEETRRIGNGQYEDALRIWKHAQERWQRTQEPWYAAFVTVHADFPEHLSLLLAKILGQTFAPPSL